MEYREDDKIQLHVYRVEIRRFAVITKTIVCVLRPTAVQYLDNLFTFFIIPTNTKRRLFNSTKIQYSFFKKKKKTLCVYKFINFRR